MLLNFLRRGLQRTSDGVEQEIKVFFGLDELMSISSFGTVHCLASFSKAHTFLCVLSEIPRDLSAGKLRDILHIRVSAEPPFTMFLMETRYLSRGREKLED